MKLADDNGNQICDISKVRLEKDDVLVLDFGDKQQVPHDFLSAVNQSMGEIFPNNKILYLCNGVKLNVINNGGSKNE